MRSLITFMQCTFALFLLPYALNAAPSSKLDNNLRDFDVRQHRDAEEMEQPQLTTTATTTVEPNKIEQQPEAEAAVAVVEEPSIAIENPNASSLNKTSVLILIRDALKKVTTVLPTTVQTEQVATNALQYFQLFEYFIQQTIERVIDDYDEDDEEATTTIKTDEDSTEKQEQLIEKNEINLDSKDKIMMSSSANEIEKENTNQNPTKEPNPTVQPAMENSSTSIPSS